MRIRIRNTDKKSVSDLHLSRKNRLCNIAEQLKYSHLSHALADDVKVIALRERDHVVHHSPTRRISRRNLRVLLLGEEPAQQAHSLFVAKAWSTLTSLILLEPQQVFTKEKNKER